MITDLSMIDFTVDPWTFDQPPTSPWRTFSTDHSETAAAVITNYLILNWQPSYPEKNLHGAPDVWNQGTPKHPEHDIKPSTYLWHVAQAYAMAGEVLAARNNFMLAQVVGGLTDPILTCYIAFLHHCFHHTGLAILVEAASTIPADDHTNRKMADALIYGAKAGWSMRQVYLALEDSNMSESKISLGDISRYKNRGTILNVHRVGEYEILEVQDTRMRWTTFHPFIDGRDVNTGFESLDQALIGIILRKYLDKSATPTVDWKQDQLLFRAIGIPYSS